MRKKYANVTGLRVVPGWTLGYPARPRLGGERWGEVAERSKALDWNSSNIFTGVRGFESHPLRQVNGGSRRFLRDDKP